SPSARSPKNMPPTSRPPLVNFLRPRDASRQIVWSTRGVHSISLPRGTQGHRGCVLGSVKVTSVAPATDWRHSRRQNVTINLKSSETNAEFVYPRDVQIESLPGKAGFFWVVLLTGALPAMAADPESLSIRILEGQ